MGRKEKSQASSKRITAKTKNCTVLKVTNFTKYKYNALTLQVKTLHRFIALSQCSKPLVTPHWNCALPSCRLPQLIQCLCPAPGPRNQGQHHTWPGGLLQAGLRVWIQLVGRKLYCCNSRKAETACDAFNAITWGHTCVNTTKPLPLSLSAHEKH